MSERRGGDVAECDVVVGCVLFGMHFSQSRNALLLNFSHSPGLILGVFDHKPLKREHLTCTRLKKGKPLREKGVSGVL